MHFLVMHMILVGTGGGTKDKMHQAPMGPMHSKKMLGYAHVSVQACLNSTHKFYVPTTYVMSAALWRRCLLCDFVVLLALTYPKQSFPMWGKLMPRF